jgi:hypothetical protein
MLERESILAADYRIDGDTLYRCQANAMERIVPWGPGAGAWRLVGGAWQPFLPQIDVAALEETVRRPGAAASPRWRRRVAACRLLTEQWPREVRDAVRAFPSGHWQLLQFANHGGAAALELLRSNPALAYLAALHEAAGRLGLRRRSLAALCGFPASEHAVRLLRKVPAAWVCGELLEQLRDAMTYERDAAAILTHLAHINSPALNVARDPQLRASLAPACLDRLGRVPASAAHCDLVARMRDLLAAGQGLRIGSLADLDRPPAAPPAPAPPRRAGRVTCKFPAPPVAELAAAGVRIAAIRSQADLQAESREMNHCAGRDTSYARRVARGRLYFYRMLEPERLTIAIRPAGEGWALDEVRGSRNREARAASRMLIRNWLSSGGEAPAAPVCLAPPGQLSFDFF